MTQSLDRGLIHAAVERHRRELLRLERDGASEMVRAYGTIWRRTQAEIKDLSRRYSEALAADETITPAWAFEYGRLDALQRQVETELRQYAAFAETRIISQERQAVEAAQAHSSEIAQRVARPGVSVTWARLPAGAVEDLVGYMRNGSPLRTLLDELGAEGSAVVREGLLEGLALGLSPRETARRVRKGFGGRLTRALRISRTETMRAYRSATLRSYQANSDVVAGWRWLAAKSPRTCAMCLAMDGTWHPLTEELTDHPNGRCAMAPALRGAPRDRPGWETGRDWFDKQPEDVQRQVLGNAGYEAWENLQVDLQDFAGLRRSREWGSSRVALSVTRAIHGSGMPRVTVMPGQAPVQPRADIRAAIRHLREQGQDIRQLEIIARGTYTEATGWFGAYSAQRNLIGLTNNSLAWRGDVAWGQERVRAWEAAAGTSAPAMRWPQSAQEFLVDVLAHEYGHHKTVQKVGNPGALGFRWSNHLPRALHDEIDLALEQEGVYRSARSRYNKAVAEIIAEDVRRYYAGRDSSYNRSAPRSDLRDWQRAWRRAQEVAGWLGA